MARKIEWRPWKGTPWVLASYGDPVYPTVALPGPEVDLVLDEAEGQVTGNASCNNYFGPYEIDGNELTFGPLGVTKKACPDDAVATQEQAFLTALNAVGTYVIENDKLTLTYGDDQALVFVAAEMIPLEGATWLIDRYNNGNEAAVSLLADTEITAVFENGNMSGNSGCNTFTASYVVSDGGSINIDSAATTRMMCAEPDGLMEQEAHFIAAIETAAVYKISSARLELRTSDGALVLSAIAAASE